MIGDNLVDQELSIQFKVENDDIIETTHPCVDVYIEAEFSPETDFEYVTGSLVCDESIPELI
jgi:hypothetical protein